MILLDTCALLWLNEDRSRFSSVALNALQKNAGALAISAMSLFEIGVKVKRGKLTLPLQTGQWYKSLASGEARGNSVPIIPRPEWAQVTFSRSTATRVAW